MAEDKYRFYLYDRWFYLIKENGNILKYASNPNRPKDGIVVERNIDEDTLDVFYYIKNKLYAKISVSSIKEKDIFFHYKDITPHLTTINGEEYVNLLIDGFSHIKYGNRCEKDMVYIKKKRNLKKLCYREPDFPLDITICTSDIDIKSKVFDYYNNLVSNFKLYLPEINEQEEKSSVVVPKLTTIRNIVIPNSLYIFDRVFTFKKEELGKIYFSNTEDTVTYLLINYDHLYHYIEGITVNFKDSIGNSKTNCTFKVFRNELDGATTVFYNSIKENININQSKVEDVTYRYYVKRDQAGNKVSNYLEIIVGKKRKLFYLHPHFSTTYIDQEGNSYQIGNQDFARLMGMASISKNVLDIVEKKLLK